LSIGKKYKLILTLGSVEEFVKLKAYLFIDKEKIETIPCMYVGRGREEEKE